MAKIALEDWKEKVRDPKIECMSRDEMSALQSERLVKQVKNVYDHVEFYRKKMDDLGVEPGDIKGIEDIDKLPFTTKEDLRDNYPFGLLAVPQKLVDLGPVQQKLPHPQWVFIENVSLLVRTDVHSVDKDLPRPFNTKQPGISCPFSIGSIPLHPPAPGSLPALPR